MSKIFEMIKHDQPMMINFVIIFYLPGFAANRKSAVDDEILLGSGRIIGIDDDDGRDEGSG